MSNEWAFDDDGKPAGPCPTCNTHRLWRRHTSPEGRAAIMVPVCLSCEHHAEHPMSVEELREALANYAHRAWSGWMKYLFSKCEPMASDFNGAVMIPDYLVERWTRQMNTEYMQLPESECASDRAEADKMLDLVDLAEPLRDWRARLAAAAAVVREEGAAE